MPSSRQKRPRVDEEDDEEEDPEMSQVEDDTMMTDDDMESDGAKSDMIEFLAWLRSGRLGFWKIGYMTSISLCCYQLPSCLGSTCPFHAQVASSSAQRTELRHAQ